MNGSSIERLLQVIDNVIGSIPDFSDVTCLPRVKIACKQYDAAMGKILLIEKNNYVRINQMHNSIGSPYTELYRLKTGLHSLIRMDPEIDPHIKIQLQLCKVHQLSMDAKWCVMQYGDYLERGYNYIQGQNPETTN